jgi:integrase
VNAFILKRQKDVMVLGEGDEREERRYSNGEINRELTTLKRILNLARQNGKLMHVPHVPMLKERNVRTGFFEREQIERILVHLPGAIRPAVQLAYITGWRIPSEVLKLQWRHVDFEARVVRLDPHTTKNDEGRTFPFTDALERLLEAQRAEHERLKAEGVICPWVFNRSNRKVKGKRITTFIKAFRAACTKAGCGVDRYLLERSTEELDCQFLCMSVHRVSIDVRGIHTQLGASLAATVGARCQERVVSRAWQHGQLDLG